MIQTVISYAIITEVSSRFVVLIFLISSGSEFISDDIFFFTNFKISAQTKAKGASKTTCKIVVVTIVNNSKPENMNENNQSSLIGSKLIFDSHLTMI